MNLLDLHAAMDGARAPQQREPAALAADAAPSQANAATAASSPPAAPASSRPSVPASSRSQRFALARTQCGDGVADLATAGTSGPRRESQQLSMYDLPVPLSRSDAPAAPSRGSRPSNAVPPKPSQAPPAALPKPVSIAPMPDNAVPPATGAMPRRVRALVAPVANAARRHRVDPLLLHAVAHVESRHDRLAKSRAGALGVLQVMPDTARRFGVTDPDRELHDPATNIDVGAAYLSSLNKRFGNDLPLVLAAYNAGEGAVERYGNRIPPYPETRDYVRRVLDAYALLRGAVRASAAGAQRKDTLGRHGL